jgi:hypothetical protein
MKTKRQAIDQQAADECESCSQAGWICNMTSWNYDEEGLCCQSCTHHWAEERSPDGWLVRNTEETP